MSPHLEHDPQPSSLARAAHASIAPLTHAQGIAIAEEGLLDLPQLDAVLPQDVSAR
jgi:hypothetical protein